MKEIVITVTEKDNGVLLGNATVTVEGEKVYTRNTAVDRSVDREEGSITMGIFMIDSAKAFEEA